MIGSPDLKWFGLAWFGGRGFGAGGGCNLQTGIATKQSLLLERLYCYTGFDIRQRLRLVTSSSSSPSSTSMYHSNKTPQL